jgi:DNA-binding transcriptional MerR regulator
VHRKQLREIKRLQARGLTLNEIARALGGETLKAVGAPQPSSWWQYPIEEDVVVWVRADVSPWRLREVQRTVREMALQLKKAKGDGNDANN